MINKSAVAMASSQFIEIRYSGSSSSLGTKSCVYFWNVLVHMFEDEYFLVLGYLLIEGGIWDLSTTKSYHVCSLHSYSRNLLYTPSIRYLKVLQRVFSGGGR